MSNYLTEVTTCDGLTTEATCNAATATHCNWKPVPDAPTTPARTRRPCPRPLRRGLGRVAQPPGAAVACAAGVVAAATLFA